MSFEEQIMSKDKYPRISLCKMDAVVIITIQILFEILEVLKTGEYHLDVPQF